MIPSALSPRLQFAKRDGHGAAGRANSRQYPSEDTHHQRKYDAKQQKIERDPERKRNAGEGLKIHRVA